MAQTHDLTKAVQLADKLALDAEVKGACPHDCPDTCALLTTCAALARRTSGLAAWLSVGARTLRLSTGLFTRLAALLLSCLSALFGAAERPPNVVVILADDFGFVTL